ncbi:uncharacterized protein ACMZJ9_016835 [Mantella aurantiaca]
MDVLAPLWFLLVFAVSVTGAYNLSINITEDAPPPPPPLTLCSANEYRLANRRCCQKCPAGTHVFISCSADHGQGYCRSCTAGRDFTAFPNGLDTCLTCRACREDEVLVEECTLTRDTICECEAGTYLCAANMNCSSVGTCTTCLSCPEGQKIKHRCNATANTVCEYELNPNSEVEALTVIICVVTCVCLLLSVSVLLCILIQKGIILSPKDHVRELVCCRRAASVTGFSRNESSAEPEDNQDSVSSTTPLKTARKNGKSLSDAEVLAREVSVPA